jgi:hypothetical protein
MLHANPVTRVLGGGGTVGTREVGTGYEGGGGGRGGTGYVVDKKKQKLYIFK